MPISYNPRYHSLKRDGSYYAGDVLIGRLTPPKPAKVPSKPKQDECKLEDPVLSDASPPQGEVVGDCAPPNESPDSDSGLVPESEDLGSELDNSDDMPSRNNVSREEVLEIVESYFDRFEKTLLAVLPTLVQGHQASSTPDVNLSDKIANIDEFTELDFENSPSSIDELQKEYNRRQLLAGSNLKKQQKVEKWWISCRKLLQSYDFKHMGTTKLPKKK